MKDADLAIIQLLAPPQSLELTTNNIARNTGLSRGYTSERLSVLVEAGLVTKDSNGHPFYSLTELGKRVANREADVDTVESLIGDSE
jgi:DNA-binding IclR family transcriptional regulator